VILSALLALAVIVSIGMAVAARKVNAMHEAAEWMERDDPYT